MTLPVTRRNLLRCAAAGSAMAAVPASAAVLARPVQMVIVQASLPATARREIAWQIAPLRPLVLSGDTVRQWRSGLRDSLQAAGKAVAFVRWAEADILAGLLRESRGISRIEEFQPSIARIELIFDKSSIFSAKTTSD